MFFSQIVFFFINDELIICDWKYSCSQFCQRLKFTKHWRWVISVSFLFGSLEIGTKKPFFWKCMKLFTIVCKILFFQKLHYNWCIKILVKLLKIFSISICNSPLRCALFRQKIINPNQNEIYQEKPFLTKICFFHSIGRLPSCSRRRGRSHFRSCPQGRSIGFVSQKNWWRYRQGHPRMERLV